ncbi:MAG: response regulator transcription factor [Verrucomicrobiales bacterium]
MRLLVIESNTKTCKRLLTALSEEGFTLDISTEGSKGCRYAKTSHYDIIIVGHVAAPLSTIEVCKDIRHAGKTTPIVVLCDSNKLQSKLLLFDEGVDDCISVPFATMELIARLKAIARRSHHIAPGQLCVGDVILDRGSQRTICGNREIRLTRIQFAILELLFIHKGTVVSRAELIQYVWNEEVNPPLEILEAHIYNIRKKLGQKVGKRLIQGIRGRGYLVEDY